jgi:uncharacterized protein (DUF2267 family)
MRKPKMHTPGDAEVTRTPVELVSVDNYALRESVRIVNWGPQAQPMHGWALASMRGEEIYFFPPNITLEPQAAITVQSGAGAQDAPPNDLFWTDKQVWNNDGDLAVLFDPAGHEVDRYVYPDEQMLGSLAVHRKRLLREGATWRIVDEERGNYDAFIERVQVYAGLDSCHNAEHVTEVVIATLGERLYRSEQNPLAAQLPRELRKAFDAKEPPEQTRHSVPHFSLEEFYHRVGARLGVRYPAAVRQTKAVMAVLQETVPASVAALLAELPAEFGALFQPP